MDTHEQYERWTGERDPRDFDKKCEDCGHMVAVHGADGCLAPVVRTVDASGTGDFEVCGCTSYEWVDDDE